MFKKIFSQVFTFSGIFFKEMAVARSIFTLGGRVQLFWTAFDMAVTGVPLKVALGYKQNFLGVYKIIMMSHLGYTCLIIFLKRPKIKFLPSQCNF